MYIVVDSSKKQEMYLQHIWGNHPCSHKFGFMFSDDDYYSKQYATREEAEEAIRYIGAHTVAVLNIKQITKETKS